MKRMRLQQATSRKGRKQVEKETVPTGMPLSEVPLFAELPSDTLAELAASSELRSHRAGHVFFRAGDAGHTLYLLEQGQVQTYRMLGDRKLIVAELESGLGAEPGPAAIFGEMGCVGRSLYHCAAEAVTPVRVRAFRRDAIERLLAEHPTVARRLLDLVSERFVNVLLDLEATSFRSLIPRLARLLLEHAEDGAVHNMTHREMAERLRVYRESATAALGELRRAGIIAVERKQIRILDQSRLERAARE